MRWGCRGAECSLQLCGRNSRGTIHRRCEHRRLCAMARGGGGHDAGMQSAARCRDTRPGMKWRGQDAEEMRQRAVGAACARGGRLRCRRAARASTALPLCRRARCGLAMRAMRAGCRRDSGREGALRVLLLLRTYVRDTSLKWAPRIPAVTCVRRKGRRRGRRRRSMIRGVVGEQVYMRALLLRHRQAHLDQLIRGHGGHVPSRWSEAGEFTYSIQMVATGSPAGPRFGDIWLLFDRASCG
ncbi:hypothetical protein DFH09DRAFT_118221 [Mycena vulgaris]|nr:hypothetical protein DFH09DRAFT_118221 [Mycena vulgaris]